MASLRGTPVVVNYRGGEAGAFFDRQFALVRPTLTRAREVIVPSGFLREVFARHGVATTEVPNIVDLAAFSPAASSPVRPHLLVTRNLEPNYDVGTALRAFAIVRERRPDATLTVAGSGPEREVLERLAAELRIADAVRFTGRLDNRELPEVYRSATVALNASLVDNMPISLLEAMASGVPIVSTNVGGVPFMVRDGQEALLVPPGDPERMAQAILRLFDDPALAHSLAERGLAAARGYAWNAVAPRLFDVYARSARATRMAQA
jgi:glycosyltransferase involved in cell wall biosynthesis